MKPTDFISEDIRFGPVTSNANTSFIPLNYNYTPVHNGEEGPELVQQLKFKSPNLEIMKDEFAHATFASFLYQKMQEEKKEQNK